MRSEKSVRRSITEYLNGKGIPWFPIVASSYGRRGAPDIVACPSGGRFLAIETKGDAGRPSPLQLYWKRLVEEHGGIYLITKSLDEVRRTVEECTTRKKN